MEASELRIGNLLFFPFTKENVKILGINAHENNDGSIYNTLSFINEKKLYCEKITVLKPIALTEEWLLKLSYFKIKYKESHFVIKGHTIWICNNMYLCEKNGIILKYVHQLQNLYFGLTKQELTIKNQE